MKELIRYVNHAAHGTMSSFEVYLEHNRRKFKIHYESDDSMPCASKGSDWCHSLCIMVADGTFKQITDANIVGAPTHYTMYREQCSGHPFEAQMEEAIEKFKKYIESIY